MLQASSCFDDYQMHELRQRMRSKSDDVPEMRSRVTESSVDARCSRCSRRACDAGASGKIRGNFIRSAPGAFGSEAAGAEGELVEKSTAR